MSARKTLPIGVIIMTLMMALAALGVGYAWWTEQLTANGSIQTGSIDVKMENVTVIEDDALQVGECSFSLTGDGKEMNVSLTNAYPGYSCKPIFKLNNHGTVPAKVTSVKLLGASEAVNVQTSGALADKTMLNPGVATPAEFNILVSKNAKQGSKYQFSILINVAQGNAP